VATDMVADNAITLAKMASGTDGNIISYDASGNPVAVATGNDGQVLTSAGAGAPPVFEDASGGTNTPAFSVKIGSGNQSINGNSNTLVNFDSEVYDIGGGYDTTNKRFTVPSGEAGKYHFTAKIGISSNSQYDSASKQYTIEMYHYNSSNSFQAYYRGRTTFSQVVNPTVAVAADVNMAVGDYVYLDILITDATTVMAAEAYSTFSGFKLIE
jgi:hypothetical protein